MCRTGLTSRRVGRKNIVGGRRSLVEPLKYEKSVTHAGTAYLSQTVRDLRRGMNGCWEYGQQGEVRLLRACLG